MKKVYVSTPLKPGKFDLQKITSKLLGADVFAFIPPSGQLSDKKAGAAIDRQMIEACDEVWVVGPIGRDCSWEIGFAQGLGKKIVVFKDDTNRDVIDNDWMMFSCPITVVE